MYINMKKFNLKDLPSAFLCENTSSRQLRKQLVKNLISLDGPDGLDLEDKFFSDENIKNINKRIQKLVLKKTYNKIKIPLQNPRDILIICRYVYITAKDNNLLSANYKNNLYELNCMVIKEIIPELLSNIKQRLKYLEDIDKPLEPIARPVSVNSKNNKMYPSLDRETKFKIVY